MNKFIIPVVLLMPVFACRNEDRKHLSVPLQEALALRDTYNGDTDGTTATEINPGALYEEIAEDRKFFNQNDGRKNCLIYRNQAEDLEISFCSEDLYWRVKNTKTKIERTARAEDVELILKLERER